MQNDIYRLSGPIVGIWAPRFPLSTQYNLERTWTGLICLHAEKCLKIYSDFGDDMKDFLQE